MEWEPTVIDKIQETAASTLHISALIDIKELMNQWKATLTEDEVSLHQLSSLPYHSVQKRDSGNVIPEEILEELFLVTSPAETLYPEGLVPYKPVSFESLPADIRLQTVKHTMKCEKVKKSGINYYHMAKSVLNYSYQNDEHLAHKYAAIGAERQVTGGGKEHSASIKLMSHPEPIITVSYMKSYGRFGKCADSKTQQQRLPPVFLHLIGQNTLADFRDMIKCSKDYEIPGEFGQAPDESTSVGRARDILPSSLFFIEGIFYIDTRSLKAHDYSKHIVEWLRKKGCKQEFPVKTMRKVGMFDLKLRLGMPYVFIHQGNCEHIIQFTDIRLLNPDDCQIPEAYPIQLSSHAPKFTICNSCQTRANKWMVVNSILSPSDPAHYCDVCYKMMHYDNEGNKTCDFKAYRYTENAFAVAIAP